MTPRARARRDELAAERTRIRGLEGEGLVTSDRARQISDALHEAEERLARLRAETRGLARQADALGRQRARAREALGRLRTQYSDGAHRAPADGTVGDVVPAPGEVLNPGETILTLHRGAPHVLAYLPPGYLFDIRVGDAVTIRAGRVARAGRIEAILPMSSAIPDEFRTAFRHRETRQLARIAMADGPDIPTRAAVRITADRGARLRAALPDAFLRVASGSPGGS